MNYSNTNNLLIDYITENISLIQMNKELLTSKNLPMELSQDYDKTSKYIDSIKQSNKNTYIYFTIGVFELCGLGVGTGFENDLCISLKSNIFFLRSNSFVDMAIGFGIKISKKIFYSQHFILFDTINMEMSLGSNNYKQNKINSKEIQFSFSSNRKISGNLSLYYNAGIGYSYLNKKGSLILPSLRIGTFINF